MKFFAGKGWALAICILGESMNIRAKIFAVAVLGLLFLLHPSVASANIASICDATSGNFVHNCGFEAGTYTSTMGGFTNPNVPNDWVPNAGFDSNSGFNQTTASPVNSGNFALSISNFDQPTNPLASLSQTITDSPGGAYSGSFYAFDGGHGGDAAAFLTFSVHGLPLVTLNDTVSSYTKFPFSFTGTGSDTLTISAQTNPSEWFVDDVVVVGPAVSVTPEPASMLLFGTGLLVAGFFERRKLAHPIG